MWDKAHNAHLFTRASLDRAQQLIDSVTELDLQMALPKGLPTLQAMASGVHTWPNNVFSSTTLNSTIIKCMTVPGEQPERSDHLLIVVAIDVEPEMHMVVHRPNYCAADWGEFRKELAARLSELEVREELQDAGEFSRRLEELTQVIKDAIEDKIPKTKPSPYMKHWWSNELTSRCKEVCKLAHQAYRRRAHPQDPIHQAHKAIRNMYSAMIECAKKAHWDGFLANLDDRKV